MRQQIQEELDVSPGARLTRVLRALGVNVTSWYRAPMPPQQRRRPGPPPKALDPKVEQGVVTMATINPWYGYRRIAVMCRRDGQAVTDREAFRAMKRHGLLQKRKRTPAEMYQAAKLFELLPQKPNDLWQTDVTYIHIPGFGWWYAITVIDYYSRYLLAAKLTWSYSAAEAIEALKQARAEAERIAGAPVGEPTLVTDNGSSFIARRFGAYLRDKFRHVRIQYRTPQQLGLLERFHRTFKTEEVHWRLYKDPQHARECIEEFRARYNQRRPHWALIPESGGDPVTPEDVYVRKVVTQLPRWQAWAKAAKEKIDQQMTIEKEPA